MHPLLKKFIGIFFIGWLLLSSLQRIFSPTQSLFDALISYVTYPCLVTSHVIGERLSTMTTQNMSYQELTERYQKLQEEHKKNLDELVQIKACTYYFHAIQELVEFRSRYEQPNVIIGQIIGKNLTSEEQYVFIDRGSRDGVCPNMIAMFKTHIIGRVSDVYGWYSKVVLITDIHSKIAVFSCKTEATGIIQGRNDIKKLSFNYVNHLATVDDDDMVLSSGQGLVFPQGFCVGKIVRHELPEKALYHTIDVEPLIDLSVLNCCALIKVENINPN